MSKHEMVDKGVKEVKLPVVKLPELEIFTFDHMKKVRLEEVSKLEKLELTEENYKELKKGKNSLVKKRTDIKKLVDRDKDKLNECINELKKKGQDLINITEPLEKDIAKYVKSIDDKEKIKLEKEQKAKEEVKKAIADYKHETLQNIINWQDSNETLDISLPDIDFMDMKDIAEKTFLEVEQAKAERHNFLLEREEVEKQKAELAKMKAEQERITRETCEANSIEIEEEPKGKIPYGAKSENMIKPKPADNEESDYVLVGDTISEVEFEDIDDLPEDEDEEGDFGELARDASELSKLLEEGEAPIITGLTGKSYFNPTLHECITKLEMRYPVIVKDPYFEALKAYCNNNTDTINQNFRR